MSQIDRAQPSTSANVFDVNSLTALKRQAKAGDPAANKLVAQQFEALFLQMVLKSMRDASPRSGLFESDQTRMYESLLDQQLAQTLGSSGRGTGLAAMIEAQLTRQNKIEGGPAPYKATPVAPSAIPAPSRGAPAAGDAQAYGVANGAQRAFVDRLLPAATSAERSTGIPAHFMVAQAALETGWGKSELRHADGTPTFNVFGIKAGRGWQGPVTEASTTEYVDGAAQSRVERFRSYGSYEEAFQDYTRLLAGNARYGAVLGSQDPARFARSLQAAGYATDPLYATKLERIIDGPTMKQLLPG